MGRTATDASQRLDSVARLGNRADRLVLERCPDDIAECDQLAHWPSHIRAPKPIQSTSPIGIQIPLHRGPRYLNDFRRLLTGQAAMEEPDRPHLVTNWETGVARPLLIDNPLLVFGELYAKPRHDPPPCGARGKSLLADADTLMYHNPAVGEMSH